MVPFPMQPLITRILLLTGFTLCSYGALAEHYTVPLFVTASTAGEPQGVLRILNGTSESGTVEIHAIDDSGTRSGPATFTLNASAAAEFTATDLQSGNASKGLSGGVGANVGDARLEIETDLRIVPLAFVRAADGTLSAMHDTVRAASVAEEDRYRYDVPVFNPSTEATQMSRLRLINPGDTAAAVTIEGRDDSGAEATGGSVQLTLAAGGAQTLTAQQLEAGSAGLTGRLGAGTGKWRLSVSADGPLRVVNIVTATAGYWNNLSTTAVPGAAPADRAAFNERFVGIDVVYLTVSDSFTLNAMTDERFSESGESDGVTTTYAGSYGYEGIGPDAGRLTLTYDDGDVCRANLYFASRTAGWFASRCTGSDYPADGSWIGGSWSAEDPDEMPPVDPGETTYGAGDEISDLPAGSWFPDVTLGGSFTLSGGNTVVRLNNGGYIEEGDYRYTCQSAGGCEISNRSIVSGTIAQTSIAATPEDTQPRFANGSGPGNQTYTVGTAIEALTLPTPNGGDGTLMYSLTSSVPGLSFDAATRRLTGTPSMAGTFIMTYSVVDEDGDTDTLSFTITVNTDTTETGSLGECYVSLLVEIGESCTYPGTMDAFTVNVRGRGSFLTFLAGIRIRIDNQTIDGRVYDFLASHQGDGVWRIDRIAGSTEVPTDGGMGDGDDDNGGVPNANDAFPQDPDESVDTDGDGIGNNADTTLRYYCSTDATISTADTELGTDAVSGLAAAAASNESIALTAPSTAGTYYYGACVDPVSGESGTGNNCSSAVRGTVSDSPMAIESFDLGPNIDYPTGIAFANDRLYVVSGRGVYAYHASGQRDAAADIDLDPDNSWSGGITFANDRLYVVDYRYDKVYVYDGSIQAGGTDGFGTVTIADQHYEASTAISPLTLPAASGGNGALTYSLSPDVPGLSFNATTRQLTGTPTTVRTYAMTYTVMDDDGDVDSLSFTITVEARAGTSTRYVVGDAHTIVATSDNDDVATVDLRGSGSSRSLVMTAKPAGTATVTLRAVDQEDAVASPITFDVIVRSPALPAPTLEPGSNDGDLEVTVVTMFRPRETRAHDYQIRVKRPQTPWHTVGCHAITNNSDSTAAGPFSVTLGNNPAGLTYDVRYRYRNSSSCNSGTPGPWSAVGEGISSGTAANATPAFPEGASTDRSVNEIVGGGINVGSRVAARDADGVRDVLTYSLGGADAGSFQIVPGTGQIGTRDGITYDHEARDTYSVTVEARDVHSATDRISVDIHIVDLGSICASPPRLRLNYGDGELTVRWDPLADQAGSASVLGYEVERRDGTAAPGATGRLSVGVLRPT